jgi:TonB family protein
MTRLQKKCFAASVSAHGLLGVVLLVTAAFRSEPAVTDTPVLTIFSPRILDRPGSGGEPPAVAIPQPVATASSPPPSEPAPPLRSTPPLRAVERNALKLRADNTASEKPSTSAKPAVKPHEVIPDLTRATRGTAPAKQTDSSANPARSASDARSEEIARTFAELGSKIRDSAAKATVVTLPGEGGGEAFAGYETVIYNAYYHAWKPPEDATSSQASADVKITVARDGSVLSAELVGPSGDAAIDRSVQRALDAVKQLPPFPATSQDTQRSFKIRFNLLAKQSSG